MTTRLAIVVQRYGAEVNGGAEVHARRIAELLREDVDVTVLTTCARDYATWADHYPPGPTELGGVRVVRFPVSAPRDAGAFDRAASRAYSAPADLARGRDWMSAQGPNAPGLLAHLRDEGDRYDAVAFVTYLYASTFDGLPLVADRALLVPTMHDEPPLRLRIFDELFAKARLILFNTPEERDLARRRFGVEDARARIVGVGVDVDRLAPEGPSDRGVDRAPYALCVGRIDPAKGTDLLVAHHAAYRAACPDGLDLVLLGSGDMALPKEPWLSAPGFVSEEAKSAAFAGATVVVVPSPYESLSLAQLEAWSHGRPTLANAESPVLVGQSRRTGGGLWYRDGAEYAVMLDFLAGNPVIADAIGRQGRRAARSAHAWGRVREHWLEAIRGIAGAPPP